MSRPEPELQIPDSWRHATLAAPVPVVRCHYIFPDSHDRPGEQCRRWSLRGATVCLKHGGRLENVREHAAAVQEHARLRLLGLADKGVDTLEELMDSAASEAVRLGAVKEILDRGGVRGGQELEITVSQGESPAEVLKERLSKLRERTIDVNAVDEEDTVGQAEIGSTTNTSAEEQHDG